MGAREVRVEVGQRRREAHPGRLIDDGGAPRSSGWPPLRMVRSGYRLVIMDHMIMP